MVLKTFASRTEAEQFKNILATHGIQSTISDEFINPKQSFLRQPKSVILEVSPRDVSQALNILQKAQDTL